MSLKKLAVIMAELADEFTDGSYDITDIKIQRWDELLVKKYGIDAISDAAAKLMANRSRYEKGFPRIREMIDILEYSDNDFEDIAQEQFLIAKDTITSHGAYRSVQFDDPIIHKVIESMGGWVNFCMTQYKDLPWKEKEFIKYYASYRSLYDEGKLDLPRYLQGLSPTAQVSEVKTYHPATKKGDPIEDKSNETLKKLFHDIRTKKEEGEKE